MPSSLASLASRDRALARAKGNVSRWGVAGGRERVDDAVGDGGSRLEARGAAKIRTEYMMSTPADPPAVPGRHMAPPTLSKLIILHHGCTFCLD